ncbi:MAG: DnaB-like helicase N-terminal domain-containing protein [Pirellulaceae bacterium]
MESTQRNRPDSNRRRRQREDKKPDIATLLDRQPPFSQEAEIGVLGSMLLLPSNIDEVATGLRGNDFYFDANRVLFDQIVEMRNTGKNIDITLLTERLKDQGEFERIGGAAYIAHILEQVPNAAHVNYYANIVREKSTVRKVIETTTDILKEAYEAGQDSADKLLSAAEERIFAIGEANNQSAAAGDVKEIFLMALERLDAKMRGENPEGIVETHFHDLDDKLGGLRA